MTAHRAPCDPQPEANRIGRIWHSEHERVADGLDALAVDARELCLNDSREVVDELHCLLVSDRFGEGCEACDVREQEGR